MRGPFHDLFSKFWGQIIIHEVTRKSGAEFRSSHPNIRTSGMISRKTPPRGLASGKNQPSAQCSTLQRQHLGAHRGLSNVRVYLRLVEAVETGKRAAMERHQSAEHVSIVASAAHVTTSVVTKNRERHPTPHTSPSAPMKVSLTGSLCHCQF